MQAGSAHCSDASTSGDGGGEGEERIGGAATVDLVRLVEEQTLGHTACAVGTYNSRPERKRGEDE